MSNDGKLWRSCRLMINGINHKVKFHEDTINYLFLPFLRRISKMQQRSGRRTVVYLAAPPGAGKTTLAMFLEQLSSSVSGLVGLQALSTDGFLRDAEYLQQNHVTIGDKSFSLASLRGLPETFDVDRLRDKLRHLQDTELRWPIYDPRRRETVDDIKAVRKNIVLIEGCWLLLRESPWEDIRKFCDFALFITADPKLLRERLITQSLASGKTQKAAEKFYETNDRRNIDLALSTSWAANETWRVTTDGDYELKSDAKKPLAIVDRKALWKKTQVAADEFTVWQNLYHKRMAQSGVATDEAAYAHGYGEGLAAARSEIIRRLYMTGGMSREEIAATFQIDNHELDKILPGKKSP